MKTVDPRLIGLLIVAMIFLTYAIIHQPSSSVTQINADFVDFNIKKDSRPFTEEFCSDPVSAPSQTIAL